MFLILTLIVLVAALNIISGLIMLVKDKSSDIAILRTMGATRGAIMRVFLITGASIGVVGTLAGFVARPAARAQRRGDPQAFISRLTEHATLCPGRALLPRRSSRPTMNPREVVDRPRDGDGAVASRDALSRPGGRRGSIRSKRCATGERMAPSQPQPALFLSQGRAPLSAGRGLPRGPARRRSRDLARRDRGARRARPAPASRPCCTSPACSRSPMAARSIVGGRPTAGMDDAGAHRAAPRASSASSTSSTTSCRSSRRSRTW